MQPLFLMAPGKDTHPSMMKTPSCSALIETDWKSEQPDQELLRLIVCGGSEKEQEALISHLFLQSQSGYENHQVTPKRTTGEDDLFSTPSAVEYRSFVTTGRAYSVMTTDWSNHDLLAMVCEAFTADTALILTDVSAGERRCILQHTYTAWMFGIPHIVVAVNTTATADIGQQVFEDICAACTPVMETAGFKSITFIALSVLSGDNIVSRSDEISWYRGPSLLDCLNSLPLEGSSSSKSVFLAQNSGCVAHGLVKVSGVVRAGTISAGEELRVMASGDTGKVKQVVTREGNAGGAGAGESVTLTIDQPIIINQGDILTSSHVSFEMSDQFQAALFWMNKDVGLAGRDYLMKLANQQTSAFITTIKHRIDTNTGTREPCRQLASGDIALCNLALGRPVYFDTVQNTLGLGGFVLMDRFSQMTVAVGCIKHYLRRSRTVRRQILSITRQDRERLNGHPGKVIWLTGLSGAGKSTLANSLEKHLFALGRRTYILDGDNIRQGLNRDLGFTEADRVENIRRVAEVARLMMDAGLIVITAFISPFRAERQMARELIGAGNFIEVFVDTPLEVCEERDPKGLYKKARSGRLPNMTGIDSPYEPPDNPACIFRQDSSVQEILALL